MFEMLTPWFAVAGGILAGIPIFVHLLRRTPAIKVPFSVVRFLSPSLPRTTRRSALEHWPLMLLRILAIALIALAFARPFQRLTIARDATSGQVKRVALLLDASASMRRDGIRESVLKEIQKAVADLGPNDTLSIASFSESTRPLVSASQWRQAEPGSRPSLIAAALAAYEPDWLSTNTGIAMLEAADELARESGETRPGDERRVVLITDFQQGSRLDELQSGTWPDAVKLDLRIVRPEAEGNAGLSLVEEGRSGRIRVRVTNSGDAPMTKYYLQPFDFNGAPTGASIMVDVAGGQRRTFTIPESPEGQPQIAGVELAGDPHPFDNVVDLPVEERGGIRTGFAGSNDVNDAETMRYYLQRALEGNETDPIEVIDLLRDDGVAIAPSRDIRLVFVTGPIPESLATSLRDFSDRGGMTVTVVASTEMAATITTLLPENAEITEADVEDYAMLGNLDFSSSLLSVFSEARFSDFSSIRFWHYRRISFDKTQDPAPRVLAAFDNGDPAILEMVRSSGGRVFVLASGWHPEDSQWALSTRFPPLINRLVQLAYPRRSGYHLFDAGTRVDLQEIAGTENWTLTHPDGTVVTASDLPGGAANSGHETKSATAPEVGQVTLHIPGRWTLTADPGDGLKSSTLLVTVPASESRTEPLPVGQLQNLGMSSQVASVTESQTTTIDPAAAAKLDARELESRQKFWRWFLLAGLSCLVLEAVLSSLIERRQAMDVV